jgi:23S rRNA (cytidine2498-2'-O)-methyltransferase
MFVFSTCQVGAEVALKKEVARMFPSVRAAFARPGFVSFKSAMPFGMPLSEDSINRSIFARTVSVSLGKVETDCPRQLVAEVWKAASEHRLFVNRVHVFRRDPLPVGEHDFEPHLPPKLIELHRHIVEQSPTKKFLGAKADDIFHPAQLGETVLDVVMIEPNLFFVGTHTIAEASPIHAHYPGGILLPVLQGDPISRAFFKFNEGAIWSGMINDFESDDKCLDIGAAPGGCSQFLLQQGAKVFGVDPGEIHPSVLERPQFTHVRSRIKDVKRSLFREVRWITADMNVAPNYTLDVLEEIITKTDSVQGLLFTLKLIRWDLADKLPTLLDRIRTWGFSDFRAKQLVFNRQEVMVAVQKRRT